MDTIDLDAKRAVEAAMTSALAHFEETMGEPFTASPTLATVDDTDFWAEAGLDDGELSISVSTGVIHALAELWHGAFEDQKFLGSAGSPFEGKPQAMIHYGLVWLLLHELHHFEMGHFKFTGKRRLTEANAPDRMGIVGRASTPQKPFADISSEELLLIEPCLEMQADHDAIEMLLDAYSSDEWPELRSRAAAISAMMMLIEREDSKRDWGGITHPKAATRIFQLLGHVTEMPLILARLAQANPERNIDHAIPSEDGQAAYDRAVTIPSFFDAVNLARFAGAGSIQEDLGEPEDFFSDIQIAKLGHHSEFDSMATTGATQWGQFVKLNGKLRSFRRPK